MVQPWYVAPSPEPLVALIGLETVPRASAIIDGIEQVGLDVRHNMMWKLNTPENDGFVRISSRIQDFVRAADQTLRRKGTYQIAMRDFADTML